MITSFENQVFNDHFEHTLDITGKFTLFLLLWFVCFFRIFEGFGNEHFWTSGTDLADEGSFIWMANGRPITFTNWNAGEPNNFRYGK